MSQIAFPTGSTIGAKARMDRTRFQDAFAKGSIAFAAQPNANDTVTIAGTAITFKATGAAGNQSNLGADIEGTLTALAYMASHSADANLLKCAYGKAAGAKASGNILFAAQPSANDTVTIGGTAITFKTTGATGNQVNIAASLAATLTALAAFLNASADANLVKAKYTADATKLYVTAAAAGALGNLITLAASVATASGANLTGGTSLFLVTAALHGVAGNALTLAASVATVSAATLAGGDSRRTKWGARTATSRYTPNDRTRWGTREGAARWAWTPGSYYP